MQVSIKSLYFITYVLVIFQTNFAQNNYIDNQFFKHKEAFMFVNPYFNNSEYPLESKKKVSLRRIYKYVNRGENIDSAKLSQLITSNSDFILDSEYHYSKLGYPDSICYFQSSKLEGGYFRQLKNGILKYYYLDKDTSISLIADYTIDTFGLPHICNYYNESDSIRYLYNYDENNYLINVVKLINDSIKHNWSFSERSTNDTTIIEIYSNGNNRSTFYYNSIGDKLKIISYSSINNSYSVIEYVYNKNGHIAKEISRDYLKDTPKYISDLSFFYDTNSRMVDVITFNIDNPTFYKRSKLAYNERGNIAVEFVYHITNNTEKFSHALKFEYEYY